MSRKGSTYYDLNTDISAQPVVDHLHTSLQSLPEYKALIGILAEEGLVRPATLEELSKRVDIRGECPFWDSDGFDWEEIFYPPTPLPSAPRNQDVPDSVLAVRIFVVAYLENYLRSQRRVMQALRKLEIEQRGTWGADFVHSEYMCTENFERIPVTISFNERVFHRTCRQLYDHLTVKDIRFRAVCPLLKFQCSAPCIDVGFGLRIRKLTDEDRALMWKYENLFATGDRNRLLTIAEQDSAIELEVAVPKEKVYNIDHTLLDPVRNLLTVLRIVTNGEPEAPAVLLVPLTPLYELIIEIPFYPVTASRQSDGVVILTESTIPELLELYRQYPLGGRHRAFDLAQERFNLAGTRVDPTDRLIDYWVALEALFLGVRDELRYRASVRLAYFHATSPEDRIEFARNVRWSYDWRSYVVHGQTGEKPRGTVESASAFTRQVVRDSLRRLVPLLQSNSISSVIENIDRSIESGKPIL